MDLKPVFRQILITLISFDCFCVIFNLLVFCFPHLSIYYYDNIFPYAVPYILPLAQIALTGKKSKGKQGNEYQQKTSEGIYCIQINLFLFLLRVHLFNISGCYWAIHVGMPSSFHSLTLRWKFFNRWFDCLLNCFQYRSISGVWDYL